MTLPTLTLWLASPPRRVPGRPVRNHEGGGPLLCVSAGWSIAARLPATRRPTRRAACGSGPGGPAQRRPGAANQQQQQRARRPRSPRLPSGRARGPAGPTVDPHRHRAADPGTWGRNDPPGPLGPVRGDPGCQHRRLIPGRPAIRGGGRQHEGANLVPGGLLGTLNVILRPASEEGRQRDANEEGSEQAGHQRGLGPVASTPERVAVGPQLAPQSAKPRQLPVPHAPRLPSLRMIIQQSPRWLAGVSRCANPIRWTQTPKVAPTASTTAVAARSHSRRNDTHHQLVPASPLDRHKYLPP